jgi:hypothetical protein
MSSLWSPVVATRGNWWQTGRGRNRQKQPRPLPLAATGCVRSCMVRGVSGSSPEEGSAKVLQRRTFFSALLARVTACGRSGALHEAFRSRSASRSRPTRPSGPDQRAAWDSAALEFQRSTTPSSRTPAAGGSRTARAAPGKTRSSPAPPARRKSSRRETAPGTPRSPANSSRPLGAKTPTSPGS